MNPKKTKGKIPLNAPAAGVPQELREVDETLSLGQRRGRDNFERALGCLQNRFANSEYAKSSGKIPDQLIFESVQTIIRFLGDVFPVSASGRPLGVPEVSVLFGAVMASAAAPAYLKGEASLAEIEGQLEILWVSMREWLMRTYLMLKHLQAKGISPEGDSRLVPPSGVH